MGKRGRNDKDKELEAATGSKVHTVWGLQLHSAAAARLLKRQPQIARRMDAGDSQAPQEAILPCQSSQQPFQRQHDV